MFVLIFIIVFYILLIVRSVPCDYAAFCAELVSFSLIFPQKNESFEMANEAFLSKRYSVLLCYLILSVDEIVSGYTLEMLYSAWQRGNPSRSAFVNLISEMEGLGWIQKVPGRKKSARTLRVNGPAIRQALFIPLDTKISNSWFYDEGVFDSTVFEQYGIPTRELPVSGEMPDGNHTALQYSAPPSDPNNAQSGHQFAPSNRSGDPKPLPEQSNLKIDLLSHDQAERLFDNIYTSAAAQRMSSQSNK